MEQWKPINGFKGAYEISNLGRVRSVDRIIPFYRKKKHKRKKDKPRIVKYKCWRFWKGKVLNQYTDKRPERQRQFVWLYNKNGKATVFVGQAVALAFVEKPNPLFYRVKHIDGNKKNCRADNIQWIGQENHHWYKPR